MKEKKAGSKPISVATQAVPLSKQERKQLEQRVKHLTAKRKPSVQRTLPYIDIYPDGICQLSDRKYSCTIEFYDTDYEMATEENRNILFSNYSDLINYFDDEIKFQLTFENQQTNLTPLMQRMKIPAVGDDLDHPRQEYSDMLVDKLLHGTNGKKRKNYLTFTIEADNLRAARNKIRNISSEILDLSLFDKSPSKSTGKSRGRVLDGKDRLAALYRSMNPLSQDSLQFDWDVKRHSGLSTKDFICPPSLAFKKSVFRTGNAWGAVDSFQILAGELSDRFLQSFFTNDMNVSISIHVKPFDQIEALKYARNKLSDVEKMQVDEQKKASIGGYDMNILPPNIKLYLEDLERMLKDLNSKNEHLFTVTLLVRHYAQSQKELRAQTGKLRRIAQKNSCRLFPLEYLQEQGFTSSLILGENSVPQSRELTTSALAVFMPFTTAELFDLDRDDTAIYYGCNALSMRQVFAARWVLKNPNALFLGTPGSGKSFSVKEELMGVFFKRPKDFIYICDPEGEYFPVVHRLHGQVIKIASAGTHFINPMDISFDVPDEEDPIATKSSFVLSLCELIMGTLAPDQRSIVDRAVKLIYQKFRENPVPENMPILEDLQKWLIDNGGESGKEVADALEMYVTGSQSFFNHRTNVDLKNRLVCFDIRDLSAQLRPIAMLVLQDLVWGRVAANREAGVKTWYYIDEFHLLLGEKQTAKYSVEMWKRFRKWGGIPTGITQNIKDLLSSSEIQNIFDNSDFVYLLNQSAGDLEILAEAKNLSEDQVKYLTDAHEGHGLILCNGKVIPFEDEFPRNTELYRLMNTKPEEVELS